MLDWLFGFRLLEQGVAENFNAACTEVIRATPAGRVRVRVKIVQIVRDGPYFWSVKAHRGKVQWD